MLTGTLRPEPRVESRCRDGKPVLNQQLRDEERLSNIPHFLPALNFILHDNSTRCVEPVSLRFLCASKSLPPNQWQYKSFHPDSDLLPFSIIYSKKIKASVRYTDSMMFDVLMMNLKYATDGNKNACIALNIKPVWSRQWTHSIAIMSEYERREQSRLNVTQCHN